MMLKLKLELTEQFLCNRTRMINYLLYISICDIFKELQLDILCGLSNIFTFTYIYIYTVNKHTQTHTRAHIPNFTSKVPYDNIVLTFGIHCTRLFIKLFIYIYMHI